MTGIMDGAEACGLNGGDEGGAPGEFSISIGDTDSIHNLVDHGIDYAVEGWPDQKKLMYSFSSGFDSGVTRAVFLYKYGVNIANPSLDIDSGEGQVELDISNDLDSHILCAVMNGNFEDHVSYYAFVVGTATNGIGEVEVTVNIGPGTTCDWPGP
jgi:hypothetical protein